MADIFTVMPIMSGCVALAALPIVHKLDYSRFGRREARLFAIIFLLALLAIDVLSGSKTYSTLGEELGCALPTFMVWGRSPLGTQFVHNLGADISGSGSFTGQYVSLETILLHSLPLGLANVVQKTLVALIAYIGTYRLCRRVDRTERLIPSLAAVMFTCGDEYVAIIGWQTVSYAAVPLMVDVLVFAVSRQSFWIRVFLIGILDSISGIPTHSFLFLSTAMASALILARHIDLIRTSIGLFVVIVLTLINWHEMLFGLWQLAPYSGRGSVQQQIELGIDPYSHAYLFVGMSVLLAVAGLTGRVGPRSVRPLMAVLLTMAIGSVVTVAMNTLPFVGSLKSLNWARCSNAIFVTVPLATAWLSDRIGSRRNKETSYGALVLAAVFCAIYVFVWNKTYRILDWLSEGGMSSFVSNVEQLRDAPWRQTIQHPVRVVTVPYRMVPTAAAVAGLDAYDAWTNLYPLSLSTQRQLAGLNSFGAEFDFKCCQSYVLGDYLNIDALRAANVGLIVSVLPLEGAQLTQIAGPTTATGIPRRTTPTLDRVLGYWDLIWHPAPIRVYSLPDPAPRVFAVKGITVVPTAIDQLELGRAAIPAALARQAIIRQSDLTTDFVARETLEIKTVTLVPDGYEVVLSAPEGGVVAVNTPYGPYWHAATDGKEAAVIPINLAAMGVRIPSGTSRLMVTYHRPTLAETVARFWHQRSSGK